MKTVKQLAPLLAAIVLLLGVFRIWVPQFLALDNLLDLAQQISVNAVLAFGMTLVILIGGIDLSVGAVVALVGTLTVWLLPQVGLAGAVAAGLAAAMAFGAINGVCAAWTAMPPFIITLATMLGRPGPGLSVQRGAAHRRADEPGGVPGAGQRAGRSGSFPCRCWSCWPRSSSTAVLLHLTRFGQHLYAIGGNREAARYTGIPLARNEIAVYVVCSLLAGLAGMIHASQLYSAEPGIGAGLRAPRHRRGRRGRDQLHRRHRHDARHAPGGHHHRHPQQGPEPGGRAFLAPVDRQGPGHPGRGLPRRPAPGPAALTRHDLARAAIARTTQQGTFQ